MEPVHADRQLSPDAGAADPEGPFPGAGAGAFARLRAGGFPADWCDRLGRLVPVDRHAAAEDHFLADRPVALRVNTLRAEPAGVVAAFAADGIPLGPVAWSPLAFVADPADRDPVVRHPRVEDGSAYPQGLASQLAGWALGPRPGESVLDLCAAPGGKTLDLAARLGPGADLAAVESSKPRFFRLRANLQRAGADAVRTYLHDGRRTGSKVPGRFDAVLLDAPCSGDTRVRGGEDPSAWSVRKAKRLAGKQRQLLASAVACTKPGGRVLYATCSFSPEENEAVVDAALREGAVEAEPLTLPDGLAVPGLPGWGGEAFHPGVRHARRVLPAGPVEGFFLTLLRKLRSAG